MTTKEEVTLPLMTAYYSTGGQHARMDNPSLTVPTKARFGLTEAEAIFRHFGLSNITAMVSDGSRGLPDQAPFDRIMVTAAAEDPPGPLLAQLKIGGIMVVPVGQSDAVQTLIRVRRGENGFDYDELRQVRFVPLVEGLGQT